MTQIQAQITISPYLNAEVLLELDKDLSNHFWNGDIIYSDLEVLEIFDNDGNTVCQTDVLTSQLIEVINREFYSAYAKTTLYDDCLTEYYDDNEIKVRQGEWYESQGN